MRKLTILLICGVAIACGCTTNPPKREGNVYAEEDLTRFVWDSELDEGPEEEYVIGVGDRLDVVFFFHRDLTTSDLVVRSDGRITLPYVGDVMAAGHTPMDLDTTLTASFAEILRDPNLSVIIRETPENVVYVLGQLRSPGGYPFERNMSIVQALSVAGPFERGAALGNVLVIRRQGVNRIAGVVVDVAAILDGRAIQNDFQLKNNDIVYVPKTSLESAAQFSEALWDIVQPPTDMVLKAWQIRALNEQLKILQNR